jgi:hypothetical protein
VPSGYRSEERLAYTAATTLHAARGRLIPFNSNSLTASTFTAFSTFVSTRGLMRICPGFASSHNDESEAVRACAFSHNVTSRAQLVSNHWWAADALLKAEHGGYDGDQR